MSDKVCGVNITKKSFESLDSKGRDSIIFDCIMTLTKDVSDIKEQSKIDAKKATAVGGVAGFFGGAITVLSYIVAKFLS